MAVKNGELIRINNVIKTYQTEAGDFNALKGINLSINKGDFVGIIGKSGSGKSTLINMITGIDHPTTGEVVVNDQPIHHLNENQMAQWRGKYVGVVFQFFQLLPNLTVLENVILPMDFCNVYRASERPAKALEMLKLVGVEEQANKFPSQLSGGQQQRVAIARALANDPPIIVADEPTGNLDSRTSEQVFELFEKLVKKGKTFIMVTHDTNLAKRVNRAIIIADGEVIEEFLSAGFPTLSNQELAWMSKRIKRQHYKAGEIILKEGEEIKKFYIVSKGSVDIVVKTKDRQEFVVANYGKGQYFGEVELLNNKDCVASVRAGLGNEVEVAALSRDDFWELMELSELMKNELGKAAETRLKENKNLRKKS